MKLLTTMETMQRTEILKDYPEITSCYLFIRDKAMIPVETCNNLLQMATSNVSMELMTYASKDDLIFLLGSLWNADEKYILDEAVPIPDTILKAHKDQIAGRLKKPSVKARKKKQPVISKTSKETNEAPESGLTEEDFMPLPVNAESDPAMAEGYNAGQTEQTPEESSQKEPEPETPKSTPENTDTTDTTKTSGKGRKKGNTESGGNNTGDDAVKKKFAKIIDKSGATKTIEENQGIELTVELLMQMVEASSKIDPDLNFQFKMNYGEKLGYHLVGLFAPYYKEMKRLLG